MPKRAWCSGCNCHVMLTEEGLCPQGHPKPSLRGIEEVAYSQLPSQPVRRQPSTATPAYAANDFAPQATAITAGYPDSAAEFGSYGQGNGFGAPAALAAVEAGAVPWQPGAATAGSWQGDIDPMLQVQLNRQTDVSRLYRDLPWYATWPGIVILCIVFWPAGLFCLWRSPIPATTHKWAITGGIAALLVFNIVRMLLAFSVAAAQMPETALP